MSITYFTIFISREDDDVNVIDGHATPAHAKAT
jgi:hypothetical protein